MIIILDFFLAVAIIAVIALFITQVAVPVFTGEKTFPMLRSKRRELERNLVNEQEMAALLRLRIRLDREREERERLSKQVKPEATDPTADTTSEEPKA